MKDKFGLDGALSVVFARLETYFPERISAGLERMRPVMERLGNPHLSLPPVLHVAGTNGKGSTCAFLRAMCEAAGLKVHVYTSPHLVRFNERVRLAGHPIEDEFLLDCLLRVESAIEGGEITFFEATTCAAFLAFSEVKADVLILEVGLGGRLDATNIIPNSEVSVITPIAKDHEQFLGQTIPNIAREKAGIINENGVVVTHQTDSEVEAIIEQTCRLRAARLTKLKDTQILEALPEHIALPGAHQRYNAGLARLALERWRPHRFTEANFVTGIQTAHWPARLQRLKNATFLSGLKGEVWLDGGHNPHAAEAIFRFMADKPKPLSLVCAMQEKKDISGYLAALAGLSPKVIAVPNYGGRSIMSPHQIEQAALELGLSAKIARSFEEAIANEWCRSSRTVLIGGSLYLAGYVLERIDCDLSSTISDVT